MERAFRIFDVDGNGTVSMSEFIDTMHKFAGQSSDEKLVFLFRVYDLDGKQSYIYPNYYKQCAYALVHEMTIYIEVGSPDVSWVSVLHILG